MPSQSRFKGRLRKLLGYFRVRRRLWHSKAPRVPTVLPDSGSNISNAAVSRSNIGQAQDPIDKLPYDILAIIFQLLSAQDPHSESASYDGPLSPTSLASCSVVSRAWRQFTEPFLFRHIFISPPYSGPPNQAFQDFLVFFEARSDLMKHCRCMSISFADDFNFAAFLSQVVVSLTSLQHLTLERVPIRPLDELFRPNVASLELDTLELACVYDPTTAKDAAGGAASDTASDVLAIVLRTLPLSRVRCLNLRGSDYDYYDRLTPPSIADGASLQRETPLVTIDKIVLDGDYCTTTVFELLEQVIQPGSLLALTAKCRRRQDLVGMAAFLRCGAGVNLKELELKLTTFMEAEQRASMRDDLYVGPWSTFGDVVSACPMLEMLHIGILPYAIDEFRDGKAPFVRQQYRLFASIADTLPSGFRTFKLSLHNRWDSPHICGLSRELWDLSVLDALSDEWRFARFERVVVLMPEWPDFGFLTAMDTAEEGVEECLPRLHSAKKIQYDWEEDKRKMLQH